jgi:hypothetical protein
MIAKAGTGRHPQHTLGSRPADESHCTNAQQSSIKRKCLVDITRFPVSRIFKQAKFAPLYNDWEAPTGGYLLTACFASGRTAARGVLRWLKRAQPALAGPLPDR